MTPDSSAGSRGVGATHKILTFLPSLLLEPRRPLLAVAAGWLTAFAPSILLAALVTLAFPSSAHPEIDVDGWFAFFLIVGFAPVVESLIMGGALLILLRLVSPAVAIAVSAIGWGIAHSLMAPAWGLVIWWPFLIFSTLFVTWLRRSLAAAFLMPMVVHALHNSPTAVVLLLANGN